jgi:hypothetical protein
VKPFRWNPDKNERLKVGRGISFEEIVAAVEEDGLKDVLVHPNSGDTRVRLCSLWRIAAIFFLFLRPKRKRITS